ncbi:unnamed protein product [Dimorphilus gyrociliatus]|uniref:Uncharacterized protein n=1 Tax=Dimorphilus gyrociliatus TaxID=2664684 RepID=A0A7I8W5Z5_9ANNE|nr:unnamed protein product [Dimorphilus gyrociliatus]
MNEGDTPYVSPRLWTPSQQVEERNRDIRASVVRESTGLTPPSKFLGAGTIFMGVVVFITGLIILILSIGKVISVVVGRVFGVILILTGFLVLLFGSIYFGIVVSRHGKIMKDREKLERMRTEYMNSNSWANKTENVRRTPEELAKISNLFQAKS